MVHTHFPVHLTVEGGWSCGTQESICCTLCTPAHGVVNVTRQFSVVSLSSFKVRAAAVARRLDARPKPLRIRSSTKNDMPTPESKHDIEEIQVEIFEDELAERVQL